MLTTHIPAIAMITYITIFFSRSSASELPGGNGGSPAGGGTYGGYGNGNGDVAWLGAADAANLPDTILFGAAYYDEYTPVDRIDEDARLMKAAGIKMRHLPTNGGGPALTAILGNNAQVLVSSIAAASGQLKAGKLKALGCLGAQRAASLPDVPTLKEQGYDVEFSLWVGIFAPKGTPDAAITKLRGEIKKIANGEQFKTAMTNIGDEVAYLDAPDFAKFWDADARRVEQAVQSIGRVQG